MTAVAASCPSRPASAADAFLGVGPQRVFTPSSVEEAAAAVGTCASERKKMVFAGGRTELELGHPPAAADALVETVRLSRVVEYAPSDQIVIVEAGITLAALQRSLAEHGQRLALDPPRADRATVGGVLATNAFGPLRTRFGSARDLIVGISFVRADGVVARGGGKVVKNVAGYDLPKLMVGSLGTLGLIVTATFRLHPLPETTSTVLLTRRRAADLTALRGMLRDGSLEPAAAAALLRDGSFDIGVRFEGFRAGVAQQRDRLLALVAKTGAPAEALADSEARIFWERHDALRTAGSLRAKIAALPSDAEKVVDSILRPFLGALREPGLVWYPAVGLGFVSGVPEPSLAPAIESARAALVAIGGSLVLHATPADVRMRVDVWGAPPASFGLMKSLKARLDPENLLAPGRFVGGL